MNTTPRANARTVLVTGCGSGIGRATAERLCRDGHRVYATARRRESVEELARLAQGGAGELIARRLDVTDDATIAQVVGEIHDRCGAVDVLVNNAGYGQIGAVEEVSCALWRQQMEVNFIGAVAVTRACLPQMRARGRGRIINVSSVVAHVPLPLMGAYCASKHALEAFSVALRLEMAPFHVDVVLIEPGPISTQFRTHAAKVLEREGIGAAAPYAEMHRTLNAHWQSRFGRQDTSAEVVAACIARAVRAARPKRRYRITAVARWLPRLLAIMPESVFDAAMRRRMRRLAAHAQEAD